MAVYVDQVSFCRTTEKWPHCTHSRLHADDVFELHNFARRIGIPRPWYRPNDIPPHYEIDAAARRRAVRMGAIACTPEQTYRICREWRRKRPQNNRGPYENIPGADLPEQWELDF